MRPSNHGYRCWRATKSGHSLYMHKTSFSITPFRSNQSSAERLSIAGSILIDQLQVQIEYQLTGNFDQLNWPTMTQVARRDQLWQHTCAELFLRAPQTSQYWELNFSPCGGWNAYGFNGYRDAMRVETRIDAVQISSSTVSAHCRELVARFSLRTLGLDCQHVDCGVSAIIEWRDRDPQYFALTHKNDVPDFHQFESFTLHLPLR